MIAKVANRAISSAVERLPYKQDATGSNPVSPIFPRPHLFFSPQGKKNFPAVVILATM